MQWYEEEDDETDFEWKEEDEEEISTGEGSSLTRINKVATIVFLAVLGFGFVYVIIRVVTALARYFG